MVVKQNLIFGGEKVKLCDYRKRQGLTQGDVAKMLGVSLVAVWAWETGRAVPGVRRLKDVAAVYGCPVEELLKTNEQ